MIERIKIKIDISAEFWDRFPIVDVFVDRIKISEHIVDQKSYTIEHSVDLKLDQNHLLQIYRRNKSDNQCCTIDGEKKDQYVIIKQVMLDGIDVQNLIWSRSWYEPEYPELWAEQQKQSGVELESKVLGETWLSHNGLWNFQFSSPVYKFIISQFQK